MSNPSIPADPISSRSDPHDSSPLAADPLLRNGSFIDTTANQNSVENNNNKPQSSTTTTSPVNGGAQSATPAKSRRKVPVTMASPPSEATRWLPEGWMVEDKIRTNGATAGTMDRYYIEPGKNRRFRSKNEVIHYLETGELLKNKRKKDAENSKTDVNPAEGSGNKKTKKASKSPKKPEITFDHTNVPEKIDWVLTNAKDDTWSPFSGNKRVPEYIRQSWEFEMLHPNEGQKKW